MTTFINDIKYAVRMLAQRPGFTFIAALVLALGIGANTALFSVIHGVLLSPGLFDEPERMMLVQTEYQGNHLWVLTGPDYLDFVERNTVFEGLSILKQTPLTLTGVGEPVALKGLKVTTNYFDVFGTSMLYGRAFHPREGEAGNDQVAVLSHGLWRDRFESDPAIVNRSITIDGHPYTVVGVAEPTLGFVEDIVHLYVPMQTLPLRQLHRDAHLFMVLGRLKRGVTLEQARAQMDMIAAQLASEHPDTNKNRGVRLTP
ncbi:MAG: ABC transporter permease, partial [Planctomycetota bacterium]